MFHRRRRRAKGGTDDQLPSCPAKARHPIRGAAAAQSLLPRNTGSSAFADDPSVVEEAARTKRTAETSPSPDMDARSNVQRAGLCRSVAFADDLPVHRVPPRLQIIGAAVLIGEIISGLPHVNSHYAAR